MRKIIALTVFCLTMASIFTSISNSAYAVAVMDRGRCQVDIGIARDAVGNLINQVQIQVKIDGPDTLNVWLVNPRTSALSSKHLNLPSIANTVTADWDSSPDPDPITGEIPAGVMLIDQDFVADGDIVVAHASYNTGEEIPTMSIGCDVKVSSQFRQDTKPTDAEKAAEKAAKLAAKNGVVADAGTGGFYQVGGQTVTLDGSNSTGPADMTYEWTHDAPGIITLMNKFTAQPTFTTPMTVLAGRLDVVFTLTVTASDPTDPFNPFIKSDPVTITIIDPANVTSDVCGFQELPLYIPGKQNWDITGSCDLAQNQTITLQLGDDTGPNGPVIGEAFVDATGVFKSNLGNGSALTNGSIPDQTIHTKVWATSILGSQSSSDYQIK